MNKKKAWFDFQEEICAHFRSVGADAKTNQRIHGVRTDHNVDILVKTKFLGQDMTWLIETKLWRSKITKLHVLALRAIVSETGADRGFIIANGGFQKGAIAAAKMTNVILATFSELKATTRELVEGEILNTFKHRTRLLTNRYWSHSKAIRKKYGLRGEPADFPVYFSGNHLLTEIAYAIRQGQAHEYPVIFHSGMEKKIGDPQADNFQQLTNWLQLNLNMLDEEILTAEYRMQKNGEFASELDNPAEKSPHDHMLETIMNQPGLLSED